jgi:hypothetical protein
MPDISALGILFWSMEAAYCIHCLDETAAGGGFVAMVQRHIWPGYSGRRFFAFNLALHAITVASILAYEALGEAWIALPLAMGWMFVTNGLWHVGGTIALREYSPGLVTSPLYWIVMYLALRHGIPSKAIEPAPLIAAALAGTGMTLLMVGYLFVQARRDRRELEEASDAAVQAQMS